MSLIHKGQIIASNYINGDTLPIGSQIPFGSLTIPDNWLLCDGRAISRVDYSELFAVIGTSYGAGDGTTTFNLPNKKGRTSVGHDASQTEFNTVGKTGGAKTHTLSVNEIPSHAHTIYAIKDAINTDSGGNGVKASNSQGNNTGTTTPTTDLIGNTGGGLAHNNLQPYETDVWIIKAKQSAGVVATVVDNLESTSTVDALSANQGRLLNEKIEYNVVTDGPPVKTGRKIDGKDEYVKRINLGTMPNATSKLVATGLVPTDITIVKMEGTARSSAGTSFSLPWALNNAPNGIQYTFENNGDINLVTTIDRSSFTGHLNIYYINN